MKEITLSRSDISDIYQYAVKNFIDKSSKGEKHEHFVSICIIESFLVFLNSRGYIVQNGKVYTKSEEGRNS